MAEMNLAQKLSFLKSSANEIVSAVEEKYRKISDLLLLCHDPRDIDVVLKAIGTLCKVFCDILPTYRIRQQKTDSNEDDDMPARNEEGKDGDKKKGKKNSKVSKEVKVMREYEQFLLTSYREYLKVLEIFSKTKTEKIIKKQGIN